MVLDMVELKYKILYELPDSPFASYVSRDNTFESTEKYIYYKNMKKEVANYIRTHKQCQVNEVNREHLVDLLMLLLIIEGKWESIGVEFITSLYKTQR